MWTVRTLGLLALIAAAAGCPATAEEVRPPADKLYFPTGLEISDDEAYLVVTNANADLRYDSGTVELIDLDQVEAIAGDWTSRRATATDCNPDDAFRDQLVCDESKNGLVLAGATRRIGNFGGEVGLQRLDDGRLRIFTVVRGDPSLTWVDFDPATGASDCGGDGSFPRCDDRHRLTRLGDDLSLPALADEPFGLYVDGVNQYAVLTSLTTAIITLATAPGDGAAPLLVDAVGGLFDRNPATQILGAVGVAGRRPGTPSDLVYVTSRSESRVQTLFVTGEGTPTARIAPSDYFFLNPESPFSSSSQALQPYDDARAAAFSDDGNRLYAIDRRPNMLLAVDTSDDATGSPKNDVIGQVELCAQPAAVALADVGAGLHAYVTCFRSGQIWVVDVEGMVLDAIIDSGRGPNAVVVAPGRREAYVSNFLEDSIAVIDLTPGAVSENRVVLKVGVPRQEED